MTNFRGATVEDLDSLPALTVTPSTLLGEALELSYEMNYSFLPVVSKVDRRLLGYLTAEQLQKADEKKLASPVREHYFKFKSNGKKYQPINPQTPLESLEQFFAGGEEFAVITDATGKFIVGVATKEDLDKFIKNRPVIV